jgi:hypothetical protein
MQTSFRRAIPFIFSSVTSPYRYKIPYFPPQNTFFTPSLFNPATKIMKMAEGKERMGISLAPREPYGDDEG